VPFSAGDIAEVAEKKLSAAPRASTGLRSQVAKIELARKAYRLYRSRLLRQAYRSRALTLFHAFNYLPVAPTCVPTLPVVYDLSFVRFPETHPEERLRWLDGLGEAIARAPLIHTISEFSRTEIADHYGYPRDRILVAYPAANPLFRPLGEDVTRNDLQPMGLQPRRYFLAVGTLEPRKNLRTLIAAYADLPRQTRQQFPLVIAGRTGWGNVDLPPQTSNLEREGTLRFPGAVTDQQLRTLYEGARSLLFPSFYEGFGMPVVEALACGTPVIHSRDTSMDEITDNLATGIPALDVAAWTEAMRAAAEPGAADREDMRQLCLAQAQKFNWMQSAKIVRQAYDVLIG
jgi:alpha-1,3-rhamnosyl/mannosyltransferase